MEKLLLHSDILPPNPPKSLVCLDCADAFPLSNKKNFTTFAKQKKQPWEEEIKKQKRERSSKDHLVRAALLQKRKLLAISPPKKAVN